MSSKDLHGLRRNVFRFMRDFYLPHGYGLKLMNLMKKYQTPFWENKESMEAVWECGSLKERSEKNKVANKLTSEFLRELVVKDKWQEFRGDIVEFLKESDLGNEWRTPIVNFLVVGWVSPPIYNLDIEKREQEGKG